MTKREFLTIIAFAEKARALSMECLEITEPSWNMVLFLLRRHLENKLVTVTSLAQAADIPYTTAIRKIDDMLEQGLIIKRARTTTGKSFSLHPSEELIAHFHEYALRIKHLVGTTFGLPPADQGRGNYYFGASYLAASIIPAPAILRTGIGVDNTLRLLVNDDQIFLVMRRVRADLEQWLGGHLEMTVVDLDQLRAMTLADTEREVSAYDITDFDLPWLGEYVEKQVLLPLDDLIAESHLNPADFHPAAWDASAYNGVQYGVPIEPTPELLCYRQDVLAEAGCEPPRTVDDVLEVLRTLAATHPDLAGIAFNAAAGTPIGHMFVQIMGDFGSPPLALPLAGDDFDLSHLRGKHLCPVLNGEAALAAADYLLALREFAHPQLLSMAWDETVQSLADSEVAMAYAWSGRIARFDLNLDSPAYHKVGYLPHPARPGLTPISPMGGYSLGIPNNIEPARIATAWRAIEYLTSPPLLKFYAQNGCLVSARFSVSADPEVKAMSPVIETVDNLAQSGQLKFWQRPPVPEFSAMIDILGQEIHAMMRGEATPRRALATAQQRVDRLMHERGRY